jgi:Na+-driven multidrug efflux pump
MQDYLISIPFILFGGIAIWVMVFLGTYHHFPRMDKQKRIEFSATSATIMALVLMGILTMAIFLFMKEILK